MKKISRQQWLLVLVFVLLLANIVTLSMSFWNTSRHDGPPREDEDGDKKRHSFIVDQLKFDQKQEKAYWTLREEHGKFFKLYSDSINNTRRRLLNLSLVPAGKDSTDSLMQSYLGQIGDLQQKMDRKTVEHFRQMKKLCTPQQAQQFDTVATEIFKRITGNFRKSPRKNGKDSTENKK